MIGIALDGHGGPEVLVPRSMPRPEPGRGEVLIRVAAAGVNAPDLAQRRGHYDPPPGHSPLPGLEVAGEIAALGPGVDGLVPGEQVLALCNGGGYAEYVSVPAGQVLPLPSGLDLVAGAALPETFFTVMQTLVMRAGLRPGMYVLVHGAAGGIGGAAIQISRLYGARPIGVVSSAEKAAYAVSLGAEAVIDHGREDIVARVREVTDGHGADRIVTFSGGDVAGLNVRAAAWGGHIVQLAALGDRHGNVDLGLLVARQLAVSGSTLRPQPSEVKTAIAMRLRAEIWPGFADGRLRAPRIATYPMADATEAHRSMERRDNYGKIVLLTPYGLGKNKDKFVA